MGEHGRLLPKQSPMAQDVPQEGWHPREGPNKILDAVANGILKRSDKLILARASVEGSRHDPAPNSDSAVVSHLVSSPNASLDATLEYEHAHGSTAICCTSPYISAAKFCSHLIHVTSAAFEQRIHFHDLPRTSRHQQRT